MRAAGGAPRAPGGPAPRPQGAPGAPSTSAGARALRFRGRQRRRRRRRRQRRLGTPLPASVRGLCLPRSRRVRWASFTNVLGMQHRSSGSFWRPALPARSCRRLPYIAPPASHTRLLTRHPVLSGPSVPAVPAHEAGAR